MKKLAFAFGLLCVMAITSCTGENNDNNNVEVTQNEPVDTLQVQQVKGVAVDGAMNSVYLKVGDDTIEFTYPDLDSEHRATWDINDSLTVTFVQTANGDSVTQVINESAS